MYLDTLHDYIAYNKEYVIFDYWRQAQKGAWPQKSNFEHFIHLGIFGNFFGASRVPVGHFPGGFGFLQILPNFGQFCFRFGYTIR